MSKDCLKAKEQLFCNYYCQCGNGREAAVKAGYKVTPELTATKLLLKPIVKKEIAKLSKEHQGINSVIAGLKRLAFGNVSDAVKLLFCDDESILNNIEELDLFNISEIKRPKSGGMEIKFFDRLKALEKLSSITDVNESNTALPFYKALEQSARGISQLIGDDDDER